MVQADQRASELTTIGKRDVPMPGTRAHEQQNQFAAVGTGVGGARGATRWRHHFAQSVAAGVATPNGLRCAGLAIASFPEPLVISTSTGADGGSFCSSATPSALPVSLANAASPFLTLAPFASLSTRRIASSLLLRF
mmetsp:Transcript_91005/g.235944  ORF Transcript_91005/g.235944 Transcript_91005/m.235944 type:complete len:137 (+) Transcript_91005:3-413(+)